jgi:hypothetical protein
MGKAGRNEMKRVAANFLNGAAVALLTGGCIGPLVAQSTPSWILAVAVLISAALHATALRVVGNIED